jgi:hypothetical protein
VTEPNRIIQLVQLENGTVLALDSLGQIWRAWGVKDDTTTGDLAFTFRHVTVTFDQSRRESPQRAD